MTSTTTKPDSLQPGADRACDLFDNWFDPLEAEVRARSREFIEELLRGELEAALSRPRYGRSPMFGSEGRASVAGHRHGSRTRSLTGTFGPIEIAVPRARLTTVDGKTTEWKSQTLRAYQRRTLAADALIASTYLAGNNACAQSNSPSVIGSASGLWDDRLLPQDSSLACRTKRELVAQAGFGKG